MSDIIGKITPDFKVPKTWPRSHGADKLVEELLTNKAINPLDYKIKVFKTHKDAKLPYRASSEAAAYDIYSVDEGTLYPGETKHFSSGLIVQPPPGYHIKIWGRSGWGRKYGVGIPHGMGLIDRDYAGPGDTIGVVLHRACMNGYDKSYQEPLKINVGDRIAQMTIEKTEWFDFIEVNEPPNASARGGFGSTGIK